MSDALSHIEAKLKRADQHIEELRNKIESFLNEAPQRELIDYDAQSAEAFKEFHRQRIVPPRLRAITGEILYQLRSSLDHLVCALILKDGGTLTERSQLPIERFEPVEPKALRRYQQQIEGIKRPAVLAAIKELQPYMRADGRDAHWLAFLKKLSNIDKHRSLVLHVTVVQLRVRHTSVWSDLGFTGESDEIDNGTEIVPGRRTIHGEVFEIVNVQRRLTTFVAFDQWPGAPYDIELSYGLAELLDAVRRVVVQFSGFL